MKSSARVGPVHWAAKCLEFKMHHKHLSVPQKNWKVLKSIETFLNTLASRRTLWKTFTSRRISQISLDRDPVARLLERDGLVDSAQQRNLNKNSFGSLSARHCLVEYLEHLLKLLELRWRIIKCAINTIEDRKRSLFDAVKLAKQIDL